MGVIMKQFLFILLLSSFGYAQMLNEVYLDTFKTQSFGEDGKLAWRVFGKKAKVVGGDVIMKEALISFFTKDGEIKVKALDSIFNKENNLWISEKPVHVHGAGVILTGVGFTMDLTRRKINIKKDVHVKFNRMKKLGVKSEK
jgi:lipopolysaccharide export system protein LptC